MKNGRIKLQVSLICYNHRRQVLLGGERKGSCHSFASEITKWNSMHQNDNSLHQHYHCCCAVTSVAGHCQTETTDRNVSCQLAGFSQEKSRDDALSISHLSFPFHHSFFNLESEHLINSELLSVHIGKRLLYSLHGRLKAGTFLLFDMLLSLLPGGMPKSTNNLWKGFAMTFFLFSCLSLANASELHIAQSLDKSHSNSQSWISSESNFDLQDQVETKSDVTAKFVFPEFVALTGRLFWYQIPEEAFPNLERISHYKVSIVVT